MLLLRRQTRRQESNRGITIRELPCQPQTGSTSCADMSTAVQGKGKNMVRSLCIFKPGLPSMFPQQHDEKSTPRNNTESVFGELWKLEPFGDERKRKWRTEMNWLLSPTNHMIEFGSCQTKWFEWPKIGESDWHACISSEQNHFIYDDLPRFIMDSYEECHGPPCLHLLDKFDPGGPGSCLKRYSDSTFFKRASVGSDEEYIAKVLKEKKGRKINVSHE